jgi:acyl-coenzyme A thioesterase PaaI-like protein
VTEVLDIDCVLPGSRFTGCDRMRVAYRWASAPRQVLGTLWFSADAEGLPGFVHGGALAACADEAMGMAAWCMGFCAPGARLSYDYRAPLVPGAEASLVAWVERQEGRKVWCGARIEAQGRVVLTGEGLFIAVQPTDWSVFAGWPGLARFTAG